MEKAVQKFIKYLEKEHEIYKEIIAKNVGNAKVIQIDMEFYTYNHILGEEDNLKRFLEFLKDKETENEVYFSFKEGSLYLEKSKLNNKEKMDVIFYIIAKNRLRLNRGFALRQAYIDINVLHKLYAPEMNIVEFAKSLSSEKLVALANQSFSSVKKNERYLKEKIDQAIQISEHQFHLIKIYHNVIAKHYFLKKEEYNELDLRFVKVALENLGVSPAIYTIILKELRKNLNKKQNEIQLTAETSSTTSSNRKKQFVMSGKKYNKIFREIMSMYDIQEHKVVTPLTHEKIVYLVSLMLQINIPEVEIKRCIQDINWHGIEAYTNPIEAFNDYYGKLVNNSHYGEVELVIQNIKEYINLSFLPENDIEYNGWKEEIAEELKKVRSIINQDDTYELEEGKKLNLILKNEEEETWKKQEKIF